jgi:hypothetical protein
MPFRRLSVVLAALLISLLGACGHDDECRNGDFHCDGDVAMNCVNFAGRNNDYAVWHATPCGAGTCKLDSTGNGAFCALTPELEPRCDKQRWGFCNGTTLSSCRAGYVVAMKDCASSDPEPKACVQLAQHEIGDNQPLNAICASEPEPSPLCGSSSSSDSCDGDEIVVCQYGYEVGRLRCAEGLSCRPFGVCAK